MGRYRKIDSRIWGDEKFRNLSKAKPNAQTLWLYLLTGPHTNGCPGLYNIGELALCENLGWDLKGFRKAFQEVFQKGMVKADFQSRVILIPKALKYDHPENPNVLKKWAKDFDEIPECELKNQYYEILKDFIKDFGKVFQEVFQKDFGKSITIPLPLPEPLLESKPLPQSSRSNTSQPQPFFECEYFSITGEYHETLRAEFPLIDFKRLFKRMRDYISDNTTRYKRTGRGCLKNPKSVIRNWCEREVVRIGNPPVKSEPARIKCEFCGEVFFVNKEHQCKEQFKEDNYK